MAGQLSDFIRPLSARAAALAEFQAALNAMETQAERKKAVMDAHCHGLLSKDDTQMLFDVYDLAEA